MTKIEGKLLDDFKKAVRNWADSHPNKDEKFLGFGETYSPQDLARSVEDGTEIGKMAIAIVESEMDDSGDSLETVLDRAFGIIAPKP